jgi:hypothetical protein
MRCDGDSLCNQLHNHSQIDCNVPPSATLRLWIEHPHSEAEFAATEDIRSVAML